MNKTDLGASLPQEQFELLSRAEACKFLHVSQSMLDAHLKIPKVRIGRKVLYIGIFIFRSHVPIPASSIPSINPSNRYL